MILFAYVFLGLALTIMAVGIISVSWWFLLPAIIILAMVTKLVKIIKKPSGKKDDVIVMSRSEFEQNYCRK